MQMPFGIRWWVQLNAHNAWAKKKKIEGIEILVVPPSPNLQRCLLLSKC